MRLHTIFLAIVVFRRQGSVLGNAHGPGNGSIWLDDVNCHGNELSISDCSHRPWGSHNCLHSEDVSISCYEGSPDIGNNTNSSCHGGGGIRGFLNGMRYINRRFTYLLTYLLT